MSSDDDSDSYDGSSASSDSGAEAGAELRWTAQDRTMLHCYHDAAEGEPEEPDLCDAYGGRVYSAQKGSGATGTNPLTGAPVAPNMNKRVYISVTGGLPDIPNARVPLPEPEPEPEQEVDDGMMDIKMQVLSSVAMLSSLPEAARTQLARRMTAAQVAPGDVIIRQGDIGDRMYFVVFGTAEVLIGSLNRVPVAQIFAGSFFGEMALVRAEKRNAFVRATSEMDILVLTKQHVDTLTE